MLLKTDPSESVIADFKVEGQRVSGPWAGGVFTSLHLLHCKRSKFSFSLPGQCFPAFFYVEAEAPKYWLPNAKSQLIGKDPDAGKDGRQKEKGMTEDEMARQHH